MSDFEGEGVNLVYIAILTQILQARVETHVLARVVTHVLVCYPMVQARVLLHVLARVVTHVLARVIMHVHDYYLKTCILDANTERNLPPVVVNSVAVDNGHGPM